MLNFKNVNVNPKGRKTGDCSTRALVGTLNISYDEALKLQMEESLKCYYDPTSKQVIERVLKKFGYVKMPQPRWDDNTKVKVRDLDKYLSWCCNEDWLNGNILVTVANHHTCINNGEIQDIWNCGTKTIGNYYVKMD